MYNGNGNGNGYNTNSNGGFRGPRINTAGYTSIGSMRVRSIYLYIALAVVGVLLLYFLINFVQTSLVMHFSMFAGVLLLLTNLRELIGSSFAQRSSTSLLNCMIGGALICAWLTQIVSVFLWIPALLLIGIATPLAFGRASVYSTYVSMARGAVDAARRGMGR